jgi:hypothetical protein
MRRRQVETEPEPEPTIRELSNYELVEGAGPWSNKRARRCPTLDEIESRGRTALEGEMIVLW